MVGKACETTGHIFVDDSSLAGIKETISESEKILKDGMSLVVFPEGSRSWDGKMIPFKRGAFLLATEFNLPVVPITIDGSFKRMPRYTYNITPGRIKLTIHKPIYPVRKDSVQNSLCSNAGKTLNPYSRQPTGQILTALRLRNKK